MLSTALGFPKGKRVTDHYSILTPEAMVAATMSSTKVLNKWRNQVSLVYNVYMVQREILFLRIGNL